MSSDRHDPIGRVQRKPESELRHWSTYSSPGEYWADYRGYVPIQMMAGITRTMQERGLTFAQAYGFLLEHGAIIEIRQIPKG